MTEKMIQAERDNLAFHVDVCAQRYERLEQELQWIKRGLAALGFAVLAGGGVTITQAAAILRAISGGP